MNIVEGRATDLKTGLWHRYAGMVISLIVALAVLVWPADEALSAAIRLPETVQNFAWSNG